MALGVFVTEGQRRQGYFAVKIDQVRQAIGEITDHISGLQAVMVTARRPPGRSAIQGSGIGGRRVACQI
jgi:hypothetical protein